MSEVRGDTLREQMAVVIRDTMEEITTIVIRESETGDTLGMTTVTDRTRASARDLYRDVKEKVIVRTDTVYVERQADRQTVVAGSDVEIDKEGNVTRHVNRIAETLKWVFFVIAAMAVLLVVIKICKH
ncbi:MAG: hypothetical protein IKR33_06720 [Bacteroidales bacterium]|nr:hypothetical protein [Bacteroidales bacterium]